MKVRAQKRILLLALAAAASTLLSGCGQQAFFVTSNQEQQAAPGSATIAPKVDIMLVQDDSGSMIANYSQTSAQISTFLSTLQTQNWDYHFTTAPLTQIQSVTQAIASYQDGNWGSQWVAPYPGAPQQNSDNLASSVFRQPSAFDWTVTPSNDAGGTENGFQTMFANLTYGVQNTGFIRPDAMLVVVMMGNGNDSSQINLCYRQDSVKLPNGTWSGIAVPCAAVGAPACSTSFPASYNSNIIPPPYAGACDNQQDSYNYYESGFANLKGAGNTSQIRFYADVAQTGADEASCLGSTAYIGSRYIQLANQLSGSSFDICTTQLSSVLSTIASNLTATRLNFQTHYLFISQAPNVSTIQVTRYVGGNTSDAVTIPQDPNNGWTYVGYVNNVYAIDSPTPMNLSSGYAIMLNGSAQLTGSDTASVTYTPAGVQNSTTFQKLKASK
jgi:hypothetical protein